DRLQENDAQLRASNEGLNRGTNGIQALKPKPGGARVMKLQLRQRDQLIDFAVEDQGVGIASENLQRIFQHGFTTRKDGHGFGLHSGAVAARNLNGGLTVQSDGLNRGARFTLTLPVSTSPPDSLAPA